MEDHEFDESMRQGLDALVSHSWEECYVVADALREHATKLEKASARFDERCIVNELLDKAEQLRKLAERVSMRAYHLVVP